MNLIYACIFYQESYIELLKLLLKSMDAVGKVDNANTHFLIITSRDFQPKIDLELQYIRLHLLYFIVDLDNTLMDAACARLKIFDYPLLHLYQTILYLDTDILINGDLNRILDLNIDSDKIYALKEGTIENHLWGGSAFFDFQNGEYDPGLPAFSSGILLFKNSIIIHKLFQTIRLHIDNYLQNGGNPPVCLDQPFIIYNAITQRKYNNELLKSYVKNDPTQIDEKIVICHFPGSPGNYFDKLSNMLSYWKNRKPVDLNETVRFITLTTADYLPNTINCLDFLTASVQNSNIIPHVYCIGEHCYNTLCSKHIPCSRFCDEESADHIAFYKLAIIHENLLKYKYVCYMEYDVVYKNRLFMDYLMNDISEYDMLRAYDETDEQNYTGCMFIQSNDNTKSVFDPNSVNNKRCRADQYNDVLLSAIQTLNCKKLPPVLFSSSKLYCSGYKYKHYPYLIHFNWPSSFTEKRTLMYLCNEWKFDVNICHYGTDGFGHQLEGILRLVSLSLNRKAIYQYHIRSTFVFEHNNFAKEQLNAYLFKAFDILSAADNNYRKMVKPAKILMTQNMHFGQIVNSDANYKNNVYLFDGVGNGSKLPPNFERSDELSKSLPALRKAFVEENAFLPPPSYSRNNSVINLCCHIRLGDAVGTRVFDNDSLFAVIRFFQQIAIQANINIIVHTDGDVGHLTHPSTNIFGAETNVLQILSDFIHADMLIITYSSLSIAAHLLAKSSQLVFCPDNAGVTFHSRILPKCVPFSKMVDKNREFEQPNTN